MTRPGRAAFKAIQAASWLSWGAAPFLAAGSWRWAEAWLYIAAVFACLAGIQVFLAITAPQLRRARREIGPDTPPWDLALMLLFWPTLTVVPMAAGLAQRAGAPQFPAWIWLVAGGSLVGGAALSAAAQRANAFFETSSRLQVDRGQRVTDVGPYRVVRHPGYLGLCLWMVGGALVFRSPAALVAALVGLAWVVLRTALEDRMLVRGLEGYGDYARRVRWRLVPGVW